MFFFKQPQPPPSPTLPHPTPLHTPSTHPSHPQLQCPLLSKLPCEIRCEIRCEIYHHVSIQFHPAPLSHAKPNHPTDALALLQTCRQINYEATIQAYKTHTFRLPATTSPPSRASPSPQRRWTHRPPAPASPTPYCYSPACSTLQFTHHGRKTQLVCRRGKRWKRFPTCAYLREMERASW